jgi:hypothetical protein
VTAKNVRIILFLAVVAIVFGYYCFASAPTNSFWDCSEFIAAGYSLGIPHPPSYPLFAQLTRLVSFLPLRREIAGRITLISGMFGSVCCGLIYLLVVYLIQMQRAPERKRNHRWTPMNTDRGRTAEYAGKTQNASGAILQAPPADWIPHLSGVVAALCCAFAYSFMWNTVEAIIFTPAATVGIAVTFLAVMWYKGIGKGKGRGKDEGSTSPAGDNRIVIACLYLLVLSTGIHFTPMVLFFALLPFFLVVDRRAVIDLRILELVGFYVIALTMSVVPGMFTKLLWGAFLGAILYFAIRLLEDATRDRQVLSAMLLFLAMLLLAYFAGMSTEALNEGHRNMVMDNIVLFLASPVVAVMDRMFQSPFLFAVLVTGYIAYLWWLRARKKLNTQYAMVGLFLFLLAGTVQFILVVRAHQYPHMNEADPSVWSAFVSSLRREQYNAMRLFPRQTQYLSENDYQNYRNVPVNYGLIPAYFEQLKYYFRYFLWQWAGRFNLDLFVTAKTVFLEKLHAFPALVGLIPPFLGVWGIIDQWKRERKTGVLILVAFLVSSIGLVTYLNNKFSTSDPRQADVSKQTGQGMYVEVRERDYFYAFSFIYFTVFVGIGLHACLRWLQKTARSRFAGKASSPVKLRWSIYAAGVLALAVPVLALSFNYPTNNRRFNWIPAEFGFNVLVSCRNGSIIFTNGDNDTFPLWCMQEVPSAVSKAACAEERAMPGYPKVKQPATMEPIEYGFRAQVAPKWGVAVANSSLLNTDWYCLQLKRWGAPVSLTNDQIRQLANEGLTSRDGSKHFILSQIMIRDILATNTGVKLRWPDEYTISPEEFRARVFKDYRPQMPIYFAATVQPDYLVENLNAVQGHLVQRGLVREVVQDPQHESDTKLSDGAFFDSKTTMDLVLNQMKFDGTFDPRVAKDDNTRGLITCYAEMFTTLAECAAQAVDTARGLKLCDYALRLGVSPYDCALLRYTVSPDLVRLGHSLRAQAELDTANLLMGADSAKDPRIRYQATWDEAIIQRGLGNLAQSESLYAMLVRVNPELYWELYDLYRTGFKDNAKAASALDAWFHAVPQNSDNLQRVLSAMTTQLNDKARASQMLDTWLKRNPRDTERARTLRSAM